VTKVTFIAADGAKTVVDAKDGHSIMEVAIAHGIDGIVGECCGSMMCATCHVYVDGAFLDRLAKQSEGEDEMLECAVSERRAHSRLSCQIKVSPQLEGIVLHLPEAQ
jgi:ferredoxin, 2Fe-2S